jgi:hypothetical protein
MAKPILELKPYRGYNAVIITNKDRNTPVRIHRAPDKRDDINLTVDIDESIFYDTDIKRTENLSARYNAEFLAADDRVSDNVFGFYDVYIQRDNDDYIVQDGGRFYHGTEAFRSFIDGKEGYQLFLFNAGKTGKIYASYTNIIFTAHLDRVSADSGTTMSASAALRLAKFLVNTDTTTTVQAFAFDSGKVGKIYSII